MRKSKLLLLLSVCFAGIASCTIKPIPSETVIPNSQDYVETTKDCRITFLNGNGSTLYFKRLQKGYDLSLIANTLLPHQDSDGVYDYHFEKWDPKPGIVEQDTIFRPVFTKSRKEPFTYQINDDETEYYITSCSIEFEDSITIPDTYKRLPVVGIKANAFNKKTSLQRINLGANIKTIEENAFSDCTNLVTVTYTSDDCPLQSIGNNAFINCRKLKEIIKVNLVGSSNGNKITFPSKFKTLGAGVFDGCSSMTAIEIPKSVTSIGLRLLRGCTSVISIKVHAENEYYASNDCHVIIKKEGGVLIAGCKTSRFTDDSVVEIADYVFDGISLITINLNDPNNYTTRKEIDLPANITKIGDYAFSNNTDIESFTMRGNITKIDRTSLEGCSNLRYLNLTGTSNDFEVRNNCLIRKANTAGVIIDKELTMPYIMLGTVGANSEMPEGIKAIGPRAFYRSLIQTVNLGATAETNKIEFIGDEAFRECPNLRTLNIPLPSMGKESSFPANLCRGCTSLVEFVIPWNYTTMKLADDNNNTKGNGSFYDCTNLSKVYINKNLGNIPENTFTKCNAIRNVYFSSSQIDWEQNVRPSSGSPAYKRGGNERVFGPDTYQYFHPDVTMHYDHVAAF